MENVVFNIDADDAGTRADKYIAESLSDMSRSYIKKLIDSGSLTIDYKAVKGSYKLREGDRLILAIPDPEQLRIETENIPLDIVYEDDDIIVVNKPQGMVVHPAPGNYSGTLVNALMYHCGDSLSGINGVMRPGIVHRIDKDTSGLLVVCKSDAAHRVLAEQFAEHSINRIYTAVVYNHFGIDITGRDTTYPACLESDFISDITINKNLARSKTNRKCMTIDPSGKRAVTHVMVCSEMNDNTALIRCRLETGRTHQIRVHLTSINHPLMGDTMYSSAKSKYNLRGQLLHAGVLGFVHPLTGEYMEFSAPLPEYFEKVIRLLTA